MKILVACEESGSMSSVLRSFGHDVLSCDLLPTSNPTCRAFHYVGSVFDLLPGDFDAMIAFPPCTYLCNARLWDKSPGRLMNRYKAVRFVLDLLSSGIPQIAIENPPGHLSTILRKPDQIIYPYNFGDPYSKSICLWTANLPFLISTYVTSIRKPVNNHCNSRMSQAQRSRIRSSWIYYPGMVQAIAHQWFPSHVPG